MFNWNRCAKINVKVLIVLILVTVALGMSLAAARQVRRSILSKMDLNAGTDAFAKEDWTTAYKHFQEYLGRNPDDVEVLKKYAKARLSIRPLEGPNIAGAIAAYRRVLQLSPLDEIAYEQLAMLYAGIGNFEELAYMARMRLDHTPNDRKAPLWLGEALMRLNKMEEAQQTLLEFIKALEALLPDKHPEYVRACALMSQVILADVSTEDKTEALEWLNKAVDYSPESVEALASRAQFYRQTSRIPGLRVQEVQDRLALARKDLEAADALSTENPRIRLSLGAEWMAHGELDRAAAELQAAESLPQETLEKHFFDIQGWNATKFSFALELATQKGAIMEGASLADEALKVLTEKRHRVQVLPRAIMLYVGANRVSDANDCLDEYVNTMYTQQGQADPRQRLAYLRALVAGAEGDWYTAINALQPVVARGGAPAEVWGLLARAFSQTDQTRRAASALVQYLGLRPQDPEMTLQLAKEYVKLQDWSKAFGAARQAESLNPTDIVPKLLRIEADINIAAEQPKGKTARLQALTDELARMRTEHPDRVDVRILQAMVADYLDQPEKAEEELKRAIKECKESLRAEIQLVRFYHRTKRVPAAISACQEACDHHPDVAEPWLSLAGLHVARADYDSARSCLKQALDAVTDKWQKRSVSMRMALLEITHGDEPAREAGIGLLKELAAQDKKEIRARSLLLSIRKIQEDQETADALIEELKDAEGESGLMWRLHQAALWLVSNDWRSKQQDIAGDLQYCIDSDPQWSSPVLLLAQMYEKLNDAGRVEDICRQALVRNPSATDVADRLVTLLAKQGRLSDGEKLLQQVQAHPRIASGWNVQMALRTGDFSRAIEELELRASADERDANSRILLAQLIYRQDKDADRALAYLKEAEAITPNSMAVVGAKVAILRAEGQAEEAQRILNDYVANDDAFGAYAMRAAYLANTGELERAEQDYRKLTTFAEQGTAGYELLSNFYASNEKLDNAVSALEEGLVAYPEDLRLKRRLMKTLFARGQAEDQQRAREILAALQEKLPQDPELMKLEAMRILQAQTPDSLKTAQQKLQNVVKLEPTAVDAHLTLIRIAMQEGQYESARDSAIRALGSNPDNPALLSARAGAELLLERTQMAAQLANLALQKDPNNTQARDVLVAAALKSKDRSLLEQARTLTESALSSDPTSEQLLLSRARVLVSMELAQVAIPELEAYCQTKEGSISVPALVTLADLYRLSGDMDRAKQRIEQAARVDPNSQTVIHARLIWLVMQKRFEDLDQISTAYLSAKEQDLTIVLRAASVLAALDSITLKKEGLRLFEHAVALSPTSDEARLGVALTLYKTGNAERAETVYQELLEQHPNNIQAINDLAWILQEHDRRHDAALELANRGLNLAPNDLHLLDTRGTILSNMPDRLADARRDFERLLELSSSDPRRQARTLLKLGRLCARINDRVRAEQHLHRALEIDRSMDIFTAEERSEITQILQGSGMQAVNSGSTLSTVGPDKQP